MSNLRLRTVGRYFTVPMTALTIAAIGMAFVPAASASSAADTAPDPAAAGRAVSASAGASLASATSILGSICLTNASSNCVSVQSGSTGNAILGDDPIYRNIVVAKDTNGHSEAEIESAGFRGECLADTGLSAGVHANWQACGNNGTVWILVPHSNGAYLESRFAFNRGVALVLTANAAARGTQLYVGNPSNPGSPFWQTWTFFHG
jgi:hypothetical protein